jgi:hypothetical protein
MRRAVVLVAAGMLAGCGDTIAPAAVVPADLVGNWVAEPACRPQCGFVVISEENPEDSINITQFTGATTIFRIGANGSFGVASLPGPDTVTPGRVRVVGTMMIVTDAANQVDTLDYVRVGEYLDLEWRRRFTNIDFDGDSMADPAIARGRFWRR